MKSKPELSQITQYFCSFIIDCNIFDKKFSTFEGSKPVAIMCKQIIKWDNIWKAFVIRNNT